LELGQFRARLSELETRRAGCGGRLLEISVSATDLQSLGIALEGWDARAVKRKVTAGAVTSANAL
jgi:hypothetical protein